MSASIGQRIMAVGRGSSLRHQLVRGVMGVGGLKLLSLPLTFAASILLARSLGPEGYGQYVFVMTVIGMLSLPVAAGLGQLITREVARYHLDEQWALFLGLLRRAHQWVALGSVLMIGTIVLIALKKADWSVMDRWTLLCVGALILPLQGLNGLRSSTLRGLRHVFQAQVPDLLARPGFHLFFSSVLYTCGILNPATALGSQTSALLMAYLLGAWMLHRYWPKQASEAAPAYRHSEWARAVLPFTLLAAVGTMNAQIGILALGWLGSEEEVAALQVAQSGAMLVMLSLTIINLVIGPHITRAHREGDKAKLQRLSRHSARAALVVALPIALSLIFNGGPIIQFVYGEAYSEMATWPLAILAIGQLVNVAFGSVGLFLTMSGYERDTLVGQVIALAVNGIAAVGLVPLLGAVGAALAISIGLLTWNAVLAVKFYQRLQIKPTAV